MKKIILLLLIMFVGFVPTVVDAHVLESDDPVGAVLHLSPDDDPVAGKQTAIYFEFKEKSGSFNLDNCDCSLSIFYGDNTIASEKLVATKDRKDTAGASYTFPAKGIYRIGVSGSPKEGADFEPFSFQYDVRVTREDTSSKPAKNKDDSVMKYAVLGVVAGTIVAIFVVFAKRGKKK